MIRYNINNINNAGEKVVGNTSVGRNRMIPFRFVIGCCWRFRAAEGFIVKRCENCHGAYRGAQGDKDKEPNLCCFIIQGRCIIFSILANCYNLL